MDDAFTVRALSPADLDQFLTVRRDALVADPLAFGASPEDDRGLSRTHMEGALSDPNQIVLGAFDSEQRELVGMVGCVRATAPKRAHKAFIWGMWVRSEARGRGLGRRLMDGAVQFARELPGVVQLHLSVTETAVEACGLYESMGFTRWGTEPRALRAAGRTVAEHHMVLELRSHI